MMYAPKLQTWVTPEERFLRGLNAKIERMGDEAIAVIHAMYGRFSEAYREPAVVKQPSYADVLAQMLGTQPYVESPFARQQREAMMNNYPAMSHQLGLMNNGNSLLGLFGPLNRGVL